MIKIVTCSQCNHNAFKRKINVVRFFRDLVNLFTHDNQRGAVRARYNQSFVYCRVFVLLIIEYSTKKDVLVDSQKYVSEIVYFRSNPNRKSCELMCQQILVYYNFHINLGDKTEKWYNLFSLKSPGLNPTLIFSLSLSLFCINFLYCFYYYCETTDTADENFDL